MKRALIIGVIVGLLAWSQAAAQPITVTKPAANETWYKTAPNPYTITWTKQGQVAPTVDITLRNSSDTADVVTVASGAGDSGSYVWTTWTSVANGSYKIRVKAWNVIGTSGLFTIADAQNQPVKVTSPNGGESWPLNSSRQITWSPGAATGTVKIELYRNGIAPANKIGVIAPSVAAAAGTYAWTVGSYQAGSAPDGDGYRVMVTSTSPTLQDASDNPFSIAKQPQGGGPPPKPDHVEAVKAPALAGAGAAVSIPIFPVKILSPLEGDTWRLSDPHVIRWTADTKPDDGFTVDLLRADGTEVRTMLDGAAHRNDDGSWGITDYISCGDPVGEYKIRVTSWYARSAGLKQKPTTSGVVHAVARTKTIIVDPHVNYQNGQLTWDPNTQPTAPVNEPPAKARAGWYFFHTTALGGTYAHFWSVFRTRLTFDLSSLQAMKGHVESATILFGDNENRGHGVARAFCGGSLVVLDAAGANTWNAFQHPGINAETYPLRGWSAPINLATGVDITQPVRDWVAKAKPNYGFVVTSASEAFGSCQDEECTTCVSYFHPIMYVTFIEDLCSTQ